MSESEGARRPVADRKDWIRHRREAGADFGPLMEAVSDLVVEWSHTLGCLVVDASALTQSPHEVQMWPLYPSAASTERGFWGHPQSGESGPLAEMLFVIALIYLDKHSSPIPGTPAALEAQDG